MKIGAIRRQRRNGRVAVCAPLEWEDSSRPSTEIFFSFDDREGAEPALHGEAFLIGAYLPALRAGERRIRIEGQISPGLRGGLRCAAAVLEGWYGDGGPAPAIEPSGGFRARARAGGAAVFVSGGLDSLFLLRSHRERFPPSHPAALRRAILIDGLSMAPDAAASARISLSSRAAAGALAAGAGIPLTVVSTNVVTLHEDFEFFARQSHGSVLAAVAQLFAGRVGAVWLAASDDVATGLGPWGSHPLLDPLFGTEAVAFVHDGIEHSRAEKAALLARTPEARDHLFVCFEPGGDGIPNCGRCEKCLRTMLELLAGGGLADSRVFPRDVQPAAILALPDVPAGRALSYYWGPLVEPLRRAARPDLADAVARRLEKERRGRAWHADTGWKGRLRRFDRERLGGALLRVSRELRRRVRGSTA